MHGVGPFRRRFKGSFGIGHNHRYAFRVQLQKCCVFARMHRQSRPLAFAERWIVLVGGRSAIDPHQSLGNWFLHPWLTSHGALQKVTRIESVIPRHLQVSYSRRRAINENRRAQNFLISNGYGLYIFFSRNRTRPCREEDSFDTALPLGFADRFPRSGEADV